MPRPRDAWNPGGLDSAAARVALLQFEREHPTAGAGHHFGESNGTRTPRLPRVHECRAGHGPRSAGTSEAGGDGRFYAEREYHGFAPGYDESAILAVIDEEGIGENVVLSTLRQ